MSDNIAVGKKVRLTQVIEGTVRSYTPDREIEIETEEFGSWTFELPFDSCQVLEVFREIQAGDVYRSRLNRNTQAFVHWNSSDTLSFLTTHGRSGRISEFHVEEWELVSCV